MAGIYIVIALILSLPATIHAQGPSGPAVYEKLTSDEMCRTEHAEIKKGTDTRIIVRDALLAKHTACMVIRCAIDAGGPLNRIISGAQDAQMPSDLLSRCTTAACSTRNLFSEDNKTCVDIKKAVENKADARLLVRDKIRQGNTSCLVIQCALAAGAKTRPVFEGAKEAGTTVDIMCRCAVDACIDPIHIAQVAEELGYLEVGYPMAEAQIIPRTATRPERPNAGPVLSPSGF